MTNEGGSILALDVGEKRVGVALASPIARLANPLTTLDRNDNFVESLQVIIKDETVDTLVIGLPRGLNGQRTAQTALVESFTTELRQLIDLPIHFQDEALTSKKAESELESRGKAYVKGDIDALAATYILEDYITGMDGQERL